jgi:hypothetical protein
MAQRALIQVTPLLVEAVTMKADGHLQVAKSN